MLVVGLAVAFALGAAAMAAVASFALRPSLARLEAAVDIESPSTGVRRLVPRLERIGERLRDRTSVADRAVAQLQAVIDLTRDHVFVCDAEGSVLHADETDSAGESRHVDVLVGAAVDDVVALALRGIDGDRSVELFGPPPRTVRVRSAPLGPRSAPVGAVALVHDESRVRHLESVRQDFVANVSHELKTPIGGLALLGEALAEIDDPTQVRSMADRMTAESHRVARLVDDLLALSEIEVDAPTAPTSVDAATLVDRAAESVAVLAEQYEVVIDVEGDAGARMRGDPDQLASALTNLLENAVKYSGGASPVRVRARRVGAMVEIEVADQGIGIPQGDLDRIFERFYRVDRARSRDTGGTGLGLSIVRNIADRHDGTVEVQSREGEGSTFVLRIPTEQRAVGGAL